MSNLAQKFTIGDILTQWELEKSRLLSAVQEIDDKIAQLSLDESNEFSGDLMTKSIVPGSLSTYVGKTLNELASYLPAEKYPFAVFDLTEDARWHASNCPGEFVGEACYLNDFIRANVKYKQATVIRCNMFEGQTVLRVKLL